MNNKESNYYIIKLAFSIIFRTKQEYNDTYFDLLVLSTLMEIVKSFTEKNFFSDKVKNNIKDFLLRARDYDDENKIERIKLINDIISLLNTQEYDGSLVFYCTQLYVRKNSLRYLFNASNAEIKSKIDEVHKSIVNDYFIMSTHFDIISDEVFYEKFLIKFVKSDLYCESLNIMLRENPELFKNPTFYNRVMNILSFKNFFEKEKNEKLVKRINRKVKENNKNRQV